ncbi:MAG: TetR/AcrR family transcriptional regulator [Eubacterium sp.]
MTHAKQVILSSFIKLIDGVNIEKVTVKQIIEDTDLSRQTFYYYFDNIEEMIKNCILDDTKEICKSIGALTDWERSLRLYIPFLNKYETVIKKSLHSKYFNTVYNALFDSFCKFYTSYIESKGLSVDDNTVFLIRCSAGAFAGIVVKMVQSDNREYDIMTEKLSRGISIGK